jgi:hypothetical protein
MQFRKLEEEQLNNLIYRLVVRDLVGLRVSDDGLKLFVVHGRGMNLDFQLLGLGGRGRGGGIIQDHLFRGCFVLHSRRGHRGCCHLPLGDALLLLLHPFPFTFCSKKPKPLAND